MRSDVSCGVVCVCTIAMGCCGLVYYRVLRSVYYGALFIIGCCVLQQVVYHEVLCTMECSVA